MQESSDEVAVSTSKDSSTPEVEASELGGEPLANGSPKELSPCIDAPDDSTQSAPDASAGKPTPEATGSGTAAAPDAPVASTADAADGETPQTIDAPDDSTPATVSTEEKPAAPEKLSDSGRPQSEIGGLAEDDRSGNPIGTEFDLYPIGKVKLLRGTDGRAYLIDNEHGNSVAYRIGSTAGNNVLQSMAIKARATLTATKTQELITKLRALAFSTKEVHDVWYRVAPIDGGIILDVGDAERTQLKITRDGIQTITHGSPVLFRRTPTMRELSQLAQEGDRKLLNKYVNLNDIDRTLFIAWLTYTMAHPKRDGTSYVILVIQGDQGSGKTSLCNNVIIPLIDPSSVGVQTFPKTSKDLAIVCENSHVACFDNVRNFKAETSDLLCMTSTRSALSGRTLYSDSEQYVDVLHGAIVMNGIHSFVMQTDLAERCLIVHTKSLVGQRKTSAEMQAELQADMPKIFRGLLECIVGIFRAMPKAQMTVQERMVDFVQWLAAFEACEGIPDAYQQAYSASMRESQHEMLRGNSFAAAVMDFAEGLKTQTWTGTPQQLMNELTDCHHINEYRSPDWPSNAIALSKRLNALKASLLSQGIDVQLTRGKERRITIRVTKPIGNDLHST